MLSIELILVSSDGVRIKFLSLNKLAFAALDPLSSAPAIGWAGTKFLKCSGIEERAAAITSCFVLPTSEMIV